jgi:hypothetical protein
VIDYAVDPFPWPQRIRRTGPTADPLGAFHVQTFTGNGSTTAFTLNWTPTLLISVNVGPGVSNPGADYTLSGSTITFGKTPANGQTIRVVGI